MIQRSLETCGEFLLFKHVLWRPLPARCELAMRCDVCIERHLVGAMPPAPEPMAVPRLVDGDAVDPGPQSGLPAESMNSAKHAEKDVLGKVERFVAIAQQVHGELHHHALVLG